MNKESAWACPAERQIDTGKGKLWTDRQMILID